MRERARHTGWRRSGPIGGRAGGRCGDHQTKTFRANDRGRAGARVRPRAPLPCVRDAAAETVGRLLRRFRVPVSPRRLPATRESVCARRAVRHSTKTGRPVARPTDRPTDKTDRRPTDDRPTDRPPTPSPVRSTHGPTPRHLAAHNVGVPDGGGWTNYCAPPPRRRLR